MAVTTMRLVNVTGSLSRLDAVLEACSAGGDFQFEQAISFFGRNSDFTSINEENPYVPYCTRLHSALDGAQVELLPNEQCTLPEAASWEETGAYIDEVTARLNELSEACHQPEEAITRTQTELEQLRHFTDLDIRLQDIFECEYIKVRFGRLPKESHNKLKFYSDNPYIMLMPCSTDSEYVWGMYISPIENIAEVDRIFQSLMWERMHLPGAQETPANECALMEQRIAELQQQAADARKQVEEYWQGERCKCSSLLHLLDSRCESFDLRKYVVRYKSSNRFFLAGWVPEESAAAFAGRIRAIDSVECVIDIPDAAEGHAPPVKLKNKGLAKPFEFYVSMYGLPDYHEIDPTPFVAITYFLLFGMMFADLGQGLVLSLIGYFIMWKSMKMELGRIIGLCGLSSAFFGVILGSVFGFEHWLDGFWGWVHSKTGIPLNEGKLINIEDSSVVTTLIYATVGIGAVLVLCAMLLNVYSKLRQRMWGEALFSQNGVAGVVFYSAVIYAVVDMLLLGGSPLTPVFVLCFILLPLLVIFMCEPLCALVAGEEHWLPEKMGDFISSNFFELFEVLLSYVSNTISFLRVGAFILVHYGMMTVVFTIADFCPKNSIGYILVLVLGNGVIIALEGLLSGIQALRLEFYEMFSRFYAGSGRPFTPVTKGEIESAEE